MSKRQVILIEDTKVFRQDLTEMLQLEAKVIAFEDPDSFADIYESPKDLIDIDAIIVDFNFQQFTAADKDLLAYIRNDLGFKKKIILWTVETNLPRSVTCRVDCVRDKKLFRLSEVI